MNGLYQVSNTGKVRSLNRVVKDNTKDRYQKLRGKNMKFTDNGKGYKLVFLTKNSKRENRYVHRLVAEAFIPNPDNLPQVNHKNLNKNDNRVENLEWITCLENNRHYQNTDFAKQIIRENSKKVKNNYRKKIQNNIPKIIHDYQKLEKTMKEINIETGIGISMISRILKENNVDINAYRKPRIINRDKNGRFVKKGEVE